MVTVADSGHGNKDSSKVHLGVVIGMLSEIKDHSFDGASLCSVNSHGKGKIEIERLANSDLCKGRERVASLEEELVPVIRLSHSEGENDVIGPGIINAVNGADPLEKLELAATLS